MNFAYNVLAKTNRFLAEATGYLIGVIVILLVIDTVGNLMRSQIHGVIELAVFTVIASAYIGLSFTEENRGHLRVLAVVNRLSPKISHRLDIFWDAVSFVVIGFTVYAAFNKAIESLTEGEAIAGLVPYPLAPIRFVIALSLLVYCIQIFVNFLLDLGKNDPASNRGES
jgi:TRAP-type C4-dicarboxylate transport system permease small subunit